MEEADLLRERLQAITDKRRIQENIAKKRRQIEEEKLKLQYMKKKALREQWLMDGLSQQSEEEQEAMKLQAQEEQQQSDQLQSNILRIEEEMEALETQELNISANEEVVLKRLKEVERTAEDIIKELNADFQADKIHHAPLPDTPPFIPLTATQSPVVHEPVSEEAKKATFAMEISVEHDKRTGKNVVVSTTSITSETIQERGLKVYDDGRKAIYALHQDGGKMPNGAGVMTPTEVEELLHQATDKNIPTEVQYHQPVYSLPYTESSRPATPSTPRQTPTPSTPRQTPTPRTPKQTPTPSTPRQTPTPSTPRQTPTPRTPRQTPTPSPSPFQSSVSSRNGAQILREESQGSQDLETWKTTSKSPSPSLIQQDSMSRVQRQREETKRPYPHIAGESKGDIHGISQSPFGAKTLRGLPNRKMDVGSPNPVALVSVKARSDEIPAPKQPLYTGMDGCSPSLASHEPEDDPDASTESSGDVTRRSPFCAESIASLNVINTLPEELESEPVTMIFMGYENAEDEDEDDIQAELVVISGDDDDDDEAHYGHNRSDREACLSYHPEGYKSKVFQPKVGIAQVTGCRDVIEETYSTWEDSGLHKPTFTYSPEGPSRHRQGQRMEESENTGSLNLEEMKLCSTER